MLIPASLETQQKTCVKYANLNRLIGSYRSPLGILYKSADVSAASASTSDVFFRSVSHYRKVLHTIPAKR